MGPPEALAKAWKHLRVAKLDVCLECVKKTYGVEAQTSRDTSFFKQGFDMKETRDIEQ